MTPRSKTTKPNSEWTLHYERDAITLEVRDLDDLEGLSTRLSPRDALYLGAMLVQYANDNLRTK